MDSDNPFLRGLEQRTSLSHGDRSMATSQHHPKPSSGADAATQDAGHGQSTYTPRPFSLSSLGFDSSLSKLTFPQVLYVLLQEGRHKDVMGWARDKKAFYMDTKHPNASNVISTYFKQQFSTWYRQLNSHGWTKLVKGENKGMFFHPNFHSDMKPDDFVAIMKIKALEMKIQKEKLGERRRKLGVVERRRKLGVKKAGATVAKKKKDKAKVSKTKKPSKTTATAKSSSGKILKNPPPSSKKSEKEKTKETMAEKHIKEYKKLLKRFGEWDMLHLPDRLYYCLESGKLVYQCQKNLKTPIADAADTEPEMVDSNEHSQDQIDALLLSDEEMPDCIVDSKDDKEALEDLIERIYIDKLKQEEIRSATVVPELKGRDLPPSKFRKPTDKWKAISVGDRIRVFWDNDTTFYNALVKKQQENSSYFYLSYDDDGAHEWLDMSREVFIVMEDENRPIHTGPQKQARRGLVDATDQTPRKGNRERDTSDGQDKVESLFNLPESYSHLTSLVRHSWKGIGLGSRVGTPSYNKFITERDASAKGVTVLEILNDVRSLRQRGIDRVSFHDDNEPYISELHSLEHEISEGNDPSVCVKEFDRSLRAVHKLTETWTIPTLRENLRSVESQIMKLNEREANILQAFKEKGLC